MHIRRPLALVITAILALAARVQAQAPTGPLPDSNDMGTFSLIVRDPATGEMGLGVQ